jgi:hypothetical protein
MYRAKTNVEHEMYDYTGSNWNHRFSNKRFKQRFGSHTRKTFKRFTPKDSSIGNITQQGKCCILKLDVCEIGITVGSRGDVPGRNGGIIIIIIITVIKKEHAS